MDVKLLKQKNFTLLMFGKLVSLLGSNMQQFALFLYVLALTGSATISNIAIGTIFNQIVPIELMGRTSTVFNLLVCISIPIGQMIFGYLYDIIAPSYVIAISSLILIAVLKRYQTSLMSINAIENETIDAFKEGLNFPQH